MRVIKGFIHCLCGAISEAFSAIESSNAGANLVGSTFNIQNSIPHKSQKTKVVSETNRVKEFQRGTAGALESNKKCTKVLFEDTDILFGIKRPGVRVAPLGPNNDNPNYIIQAGNVFGFIISIENII